MAALESLKRQTMQDWELIVSPDDGDDYGELSRSDPRVKVIQSRAVQTGRPKPATAPWPAHPARWSRFLMMMTGWSPPSSPRPSPISNLT